MKSTPRSKSSNLRSRSESKNISGRKKIINQQSPQKALGRGRLFDRKKDVLEQKQKPRKFEATDGTKKRIEPIKEKYIEKSEENVNVESETKDEMKIDEHPERDSDVSSREISSESSMDSDVERGEKKKMLLPGFDEGSELSSQMGGEENDEFEVDDIAALSSDDDIEETSRRLKKIKDSEEKLAAQEIKHNFEKNVAEVQEFLSLPVIEMNSYSKHKLSQVKKEQVEESQSVLKERINSIIEILSNFKILGNSRYSRGDYIEQLTHDMSKYYGYLIDLIQMFLQMFSPQECIEFIEASEKPRPIVIRTNTLKTRRRDLATALIKRGVTLEPVAKWSKVGLKIIESSVPIGATPEYMAGHYILQSAASLCPVIALDPQPDEIILDLASAPGGKTSYICQLMKNTGIVMANDLKPLRQKATVANLARLGVKNATVCCYDGRKFPTFVGGFDRVLLDAPCSGLGIISHDPSVKMQRTSSDIFETVRLQKELLRSAVDYVKVKSKLGGIIVYSTCSVSVEENEQVIQYILECRNVKLIPCNLEHGSPGFTRIRDKRFHPSMSLTRRFYPHVHNMDGFFVAKLKKFADGPKRKSKKESGSKDVTRRKKGNDVTEKMNGASGSNRSRKIIQEPVSGESLTDTEANESSDVDVCSLSKYNHNPKQCNVAKSKNSHKDKNTLLMDVKSSSSSTDENRSTSQRSYKDTDEKFESKGTSKSCKGPPCCVSTAGDHKTKDETKESNRMISPNKSSHSDDLYEDSRKKTDERRKRRKLNQNAIRKMYSHLRAFGTTVKSET